MLTDEGYALIRKYEGYLKQLNDGTGRVRPYICPAGVATVGLGSTRYFAYDGVTARVQGKVKITDEPITKERAEECFRGELHQNEMAFDRYTTRKVHPLSRGAAVSFIYNCGEGAYRGSTLRKVINSGDWERIPREFAKWRMGGGRVLLGLQRRRADEARLFMAGVQRLQSGEGSYAPQPLKAEPTPAPAPPPLPPEIPPPITETPIGWWHKTVEWILT
jgi:lysozyme